MELEINFDSDSPPIWLPGSIDRLERHNLIGNRSLDVDAAIVKPGLHPVPGVVGIVVDHELAAEFGENGSHPANERVETRRVNAGEVPVVEHPDKITQRMAKPPHPRQPVYRAAVSAKLLPGHFARLAVGLQPADAGGPKHALHW